LSIVLVEDDPDVAALILELLRDVGHEAIHLRGRAGIAPDAAVPLVITDLLSVGAPKPDRASEWVATLRATYPKAAIVVVTAHRGVVLPGPGGPDALIEKPFAIDDFARTIRPYLPRA
jgi:DNA-binding response OmpR family regulator